MGLMQGLPLWQLESRIVLVLNHNFFLDGDPTFASKETVNQCPLRASVVVFDVARAYQSNQIKNEIFKSAIEGQHATEQVHSLSYI